MAQAIDSLLGDRTRLDRAKSLALKAFQEEFCWERQSNLVLDKIHQVIGPPVN